MLVADQVQQIADAVYAGRHDVVLLVIDASRLPYEVRVENLGGGDQLFPHIYGPLLVETVDTLDVPVDVNGRLTIEALLPDRWPGDPEECDGR